MMCKYQVANVYIHYLCRCYIGLTILLSFRSTWQCPVCQTNYDNSLIEHMLIDALNRKAMAYVLQDIQCKKCVQVSFIF